MDANPVLVEATRGNWVENRHRGAFVVCNDKGQVVAAAGDIESHVFPRSAIKSMQALTLFETGAAERYHFTDEQLALACASHHAEPAHVAVVTALLSQLGLSADNLECGAHPPINASARERLRGTSELPSPLHNNCSGKHSGMLADALALGVATSGYIGPEHPVQHAVRHVIETLIDAPLSEGRCGTDGCSVPTWAAPLRGFAQGFARMATGIGLPPQLAAGARRLFDAATMYPHLVAGTGHFDTEAMGAFRGRLMQKGGAEGVQCGAIRDLGLGYAIKCDDGNMAASVLMVAELLRRLANPDGEQAAVLERFTPQPIRNVRGATVGELRAAPALRSAF